MLSIRMTRVGSKKKPYFRVVVTEARSAREGSFVENLGHVQPAVEAGEGGRSTRSASQHWLKKGAKPSDSVRTLLAQAPVARPVGCRPKRPRRSNVRRSDARVSRQPAAGGRRSRGPRAGRSSRRGAGDREPSGAA